MSKKNKPQDTAATAQDTAATAQDTAATAQDTAPAAPVIAPPADAVTVEAVRAEDIARAAVTVNVTSRMDPEGVADVVREVLHRDAPAEVPPSSIDLGLAERLDAALARNARLDATLSAIATHVFFPPATHVHLNEPDALSLLIELVRATAEEFRALVAALEPGAAERVTAGQWSAFLRSRHWIPTGEALQGAVLCYRREDCTVRVPVDGDPARTATLVDAIAVAERLPPTRVVALASLAG